MLFGRDYELRIGRSYESDESEETSLDRQIALIEEFKTLNKIQSGFGVLPVVAEDDVLQFEDNEEILIRDNHITFDIEKTGGDNTSGNTATISIYNLSNESVLLIERVTGTKNFIELLAGYSNDVLKTVFRGNIVRVEDSFDGLDRVTKVICSDGGVYLQTRIVTRVYPKGTKINTIIDDLIDELYLPRGTISRLPDTTVTTKAISIHGKASDQLKRILEIFNYSFNIQDLFINITPKETDVVAEDAVSNGFIPLISVDTGLIGSPAVLSDTTDLSMVEAKTQSTAGVKFKTLLNGEYNPGGYVKLESASYIGVYRILKVVHEGSYEGDTWYSELEAELVSQETVDTDSALPDDPDTNEDDTDQRKVFSLTESTLSVL